MMKMTESETVLEVLPELFLKPPSSEEAIEILNFMGFESTLSLTDLDLEIKKEFTRFFIAPGQHKLPPYESYWHRKKQEEDPVNAPRLYSRTTDEVKTIFEQLEIQTLGDFHEPPDHISFELSVYFTLFGLQHPEVSEIKNEFISNHFKQWIPAYLKKLSTREGYFYPALAKHILEVIEQQEAKPFAAI